MPFVQLTGNARTHGFVTGNPERHGGLQGYCDRKENEVDTVWGIPDAQSSPRKRRRGGGGFCPCLRPSLLSPPPWLAKGPRAHPGTARRHVRPSPSPRLCLPCRSSRVRPPRATRAPTGTPTLLRRLGLLTVLHSVFS